MNEIKDEILSRSVPSSSDFTDDQTTTALVLPLLYNLIYIYNRVRWKLIQL